MTVWRRIKPLNTLELFLVDRVKAYRTRSPVGGVRKIQVMQDTGETEHMAAPGHPRSDWRRKTDGAGHQSLLLCASLAAVPRGERRGRCAWYDNLQDISPLEEDVWVRKVYGVVSGRGHHEPVLGIQKSFSTPYSMSNRFLPASVRARKMRVSWWEGEI